MSIDIRITGSANLANVSREMKRLQASTADLNAAFASTNAMMANKGDIEGQIKGYRTAQVHQDALRDSMLALTRANGDYNATSMKLAKQSDVLIERVQKQQMGWRELRREGKALNEVYKQQMAMQKAYAVSWGTTAAGNSKVDLFTPALISQGKGLDTARTKLGFYREVLKSVTVQTENFGKNTQWAGRQLMAGMTYPLTIAAGVAVKAAYDTDKALTQIVKVYGDGSSAMKETEESIRNAAMGSAKHLTQYGQSIEDTLEIQSQLASTGVTGQDLQDTTEIVSKARLLGELNVQDAMQATINLQQTFKMSNDELTESFAYMNKIENETSLTMQDFVVGIPKVSGVFNSLGADIQDMGVLFTAMKTAGIDAKEGGNAIKSMVFKDIAPTGPALKKFNEATGQSLKDIVESTKGKPIETLQAIGQAMKDLDAPSRVEIFSKVFGIHQGSKAMGLVDSLTNGLTDMNSQIYRAMEISNEDPLGWMSTANSELRTLKEADWVKAKAAIEEIKIALVDFGKVFLAEGAPILKQIAGYLGSIGEAFSGMSTGTKNFVMLGIIIGALVGPLTMLVGLTFNFIAQMMKLGNIIGLPFAKKFDLMTTKQKAMALMQERSTLAAEDMSLALDRQVKSMNQLVALQRSKYQIGPAGTQVAAAGMGAGGLGGSSGPAATGVALGTKNSAGLDKASKSARDIAGDSDKTRRSWDDISNKAQTLGVAAGALGSMSTNSDNVLNKISNIVFVGSLVGPAIVGGLKKSAPAIKSFMASLSMQAVPWTAGVLSSRAGGAAARTGGRLSGATSKLGQNASKAVSSLKAMGPALMSAAGPIGIVTGLFAGFFYMLHKKQKEAVEQQAAFNNMMQETGDLLGFASASAKELEVGGENSEQQYVAYAQKLLDSNADLKKRIEGMSAEQLSEESVIARSIQQAKAEMVANGWSKEEAAEAARVYATAMNKGVVDGIDKKITVDVFANIDAAKVSNLQRIQDAFDDAMDNSSVAKNRSAFTYDIDRGTVGSDAQGGYIDEKSPMVKSASLTQSGREALEEGLKAAYETYITLEEEERKKAFQRMGNSTYDGLGEVYAGMTDAQKKALEEVGVYDEVALAQYADKNGPQALIDYMAEKGVSLSTEDQKALMANFELIRSTIISLLAQATGKTRDEIEKEYKDSPLLDFNTLIGEPQFKGVNKIQRSLKSVREAYETQIKSLEWAGIKLTESQKLGILNRHREELGYKKATKLSEGFTKAVEKETDAIDDSTAAKQKNARIKGDGGLFGGSMDSDPTVVTPDTNEDQARALVDTYKDVMSKTANDLYDMAATEMEEIYQGKMDAIENDYEARERRLDAQQERKEAEFDKRQETIDEDFDRKERAFETRWDANMEAFEARWDTTNERFISKWDDTMERFDEAADRRRETLEKQYDTRIKAIDLEIKAEQDAEEVRQKIFEKEKARIQHLADMANRRIDIDVALNTGNLDEAARLSNDAQAAIELYDVDDGGEFSQSASDKRIENLENRKTNIEKQKDGALERLEERMKAEREALEEERKNAEKSLDIARERERKKLESQRESQRMSLESQRKAANKRLETERKAYSKELEIARKTNSDNREDKRRSEEKKYAYAKKAIEQELATLKAFVPRNEEELRTHMVKVGKAYDRYGGGLKTKGNAWSKVIREKLVGHTDLARVEMQNKIRWESMAKKIAGRITKGAFNMSFTQFMKWVNGGAMPSEAAKLYGGSGSKITPGSGVNKDNLNTTGRGGTTVHRHKGGIIDGTTGSRAGFSGKGQSQSEIYVNALKGEAVLNRQATRMLGEDGVNRLNSGSAWSEAYSGVNKSQQRGEPTGVGGLVGGMMAGMMNSILKRGIEQKGNEQKAKDVAASVMGIFGPVNSDFDAFWQALAKQESGGNYSAVNRGTGALGKYQVMPSNVAPWGRQYLGESITPSQFLASPEIQDRLVRAVLGSYYKQWGPRGAAAAWYAGPANHDLHMSTRAQPGGPSIKGYVDSIMAMMNSILATSGGPMGGNSGDVWPGMGWSKQWNIVKRAFPDAVLTSSVRNWGTGSYHDRGRAIDIGYSMTKEGIAKMDRVFEWIYANYGTKSTELIWAPQQNRNIKNGRHLNYGPSTNAIHYNHVHWAMRNGGIVPGVGSGDKTHIMGEPGEFMVRKKAVEKVGPDFLRAINSDRFVNMPDRPNWGSAVMSDSVDSSALYQYNIEIDARGNAKAEDVGEAVRKVLTDIERQKGSSRVIGGSSG